MADVSPPAPSIAFSPFTLDVPKVPDRPSGRDGRPAIAVLPFLLVGGPGPHDIVADALPADIAMDLSRLPWLFVIARGSSFQFRGAEVDPVAVGRELSVGYCLTGSIEIAGQKVTVSAALVDTAGGTMIWAENWRGGLPELQHMRPEIEARVVSALEVHIPRNEVRMARSRPATELDAWASFHLGLDHMYRFTQAGNVRATELFERSLALDLYFSRALGGLSFTHFQNAFLNFAQGPETEIEAARTLAHKAVEADRIDSFAHFSVGRSLWLEGRLGDSLEWFDRATGLSPSFAQGVYNRGLVGTMLGTVESADADLALALELSPLDPLAYAMVSSRALIQVQAGDFEKAADLGIRAAMMPGAHQHIALIAAVTADLAGKDAEAQEWLARAIRADREISTAKFFRAFPFAETQGRELIEQSLANLGV